MSQSNDTEMSTFRVRSSSEDSHHPLSRHGTSEIPGVNSSGGFHPLSQNETSSEPGPRPRRSLRLSCGNFIHKSLPWLALSIATTLYALTIVYAWWPRRFSKHAIIGGSPTRALGFLAIISQVGGVFLVSSIAHGLATLCNTLLARTNGIAFLEFLALHAGTAFEGWCYIFACSPWPSFRPRFWSIFRLVCIAVVPVSQILILLNVDTSIYFQKARQIEGVRGYGIGDFNSSLATTLQPLADSFFSSRFKDFTTDSDLVLIITEAAARDACEKSKDLSIGCRTTYFVPGGIQNGAPDYLNNKNFPFSNSLQPILALEQNGYVFDFEDELIVNSTSPAAGAYEENECITFGYSIGAVRLCLRNGNGNQIQAFLTYCPKDIAIKMKCLNSSWPISTAWGTTLSVSKRRANIGYNGHNGTILFHEFTTLPVDYSINTTELRQVYDTLFNKIVSITSPWGVILKAINVDPKKAMAPFTIWEYFVGLADLTSNNPRTTLQAFTGVHSLLSLAIYHCQNKNFADLRKSLLNGVDTNSSSSLVNTLIEQALPYAEPDTDIVPAEVRWNINVGHATLIAFMAIHGATIVLCWAAQCIESCTPLGKAGRHMGTFPLIDEKADTEYKVRRIRQRGVARETRADQPLANFRGLEQEGRLAATERFVVYLVDKDETARAQTTERPSIGTQTDEDEHQEGTTGERLMSQATTLEETTQEPILEDRKFPDGSYPSQEPSIPSIVAGPSSDLVPPYQAPPCRRVVSRE